jgi:hypothetical protein
MRARANFTAALIHTTGSERGVREEIDMPLLSARPPELLRRPVNVGGSPSFEEWTLESLDEWTGLSPVALYRFTGHSHRDPNVRPDPASGRVLPWRT